MTGRTTRLERGIIPGMTTIKPLEHFIILAAILLLAVACRQDAAPSTIIIVATPTPSISSNSPQPEDQTVGAQPATKPSSAQPHDPKLKDWTSQQHSAVDKAIKEAYGVFAKDLDECISELGEPDGGPFKNDLARYEAAVTQSLYLECIQRKLSQG